MCGGGLSRAKTMPKHWLDEEVLCGSRRWGQLRTAATTPSQSHKSYEKAGESAEGRDAEPVWGCGSFRQIGCFQQFESVAPVARIAQARLPAVTRQFAYRGLRLEAVGISERNREGLRVAD